jgi:hypothetical protein
VAVSDLVMLERSCEADVEQAMLAAAIASPAIDPAPRVGRHGVKEIPRHGSHFEVPAAHGPDVTCVAAAATAALAGIVARSPSSR